MTQSKASETTINIDTTDSMGTITITGTNDMDSSYAFELGDITVDTIDISSITSGTISTITLDDTHWADSITWNQIEFEDSMPSVAKVEDMCKDYPALDKAYENFKTIYKMVHQDWKGKNDKDEELPF